MVTIRVTAGAPPVPRAAASRSRMRVASGSSPRRARAGGDTGATCGPGTAPAATDGVPLATAAEGADDAAGAGADADVDDATDGRPGAEAEAEAVDAGGAAVASEDGAIDAPAPAAASVPRAALRSLPISWASGSGGSIGYRSRTSRWR